MKHRVIAALLLGILQVTFSISRSLAQDLTWEQYTIAAKDLRAQSRYQEAEKLYLDALKRAEENGPEGPRVATSLNNLGSLYNILGRYAAAEPLYQRALEIDRKISGSEHPASAITLTNLAVLYERMGKYALAESLQKQALDIYDK